MEAPGDLRFALVSSTHHFMLSFLPLRDPESRLALSHFMKVVNASALPIAELDQVLIRCLRALSRVAGHRIPSLVEQYLATRRQEQCAWHFQSCVEALLSYKGVDHPAVRKAITLMEAHYSDPHLRQEFIATSVGLTPATLSRAFLAATGLSYTAYLRRLRLTAAAELLVGSTRIKDVWVQVGFNHASNFDHDFKRYFGTTPRDYRRNATRFMNVASGRDAIEPRLASHPKTCQHRREGRVLLVDDDSGTLLTLKEYLQLCGYSVTAASDGRQGLRDIVAVQPAAVLLDYRLPDMNGIDCLRALRQLDHIVQPAVALFTADWTLYDRASELHELSAVIASKMCSLEEVDELLHGLLSGRNFESLQPTHSGFY